MNDKNHIISVDWQKAFHKIQHPFMLRTSPQSRYRGSILNIIKIIYDKPTTHTLFRGEKFKAFSLRSEQEKNAHSHCFYLT